MFLYRYLYHIFDRVTGFNLKKGLEEALKFDTWSRNQIDEFHIHQFEELQKKACNSSFYKSFKGAAFSEFPIITKKDIICGADHFYTHVRKPYQIISTSGSTGSPFTFALSKEMLLAKRIAHQRMLAWYHLKREDKEMKIGGSPISSMKKIYYLFRNKRFRDTYQLEEDYLKKIIRQYNRFKPKILVGYPSAIFTICNYIISKKISVHQPEIMVTHAENFYEKYIESFRLAFPEAKHVNQYWATEANLGVTCPHGNIHIDEDTVICEVINQDENGIGELVLTNLYSYDFPLIKYNIEDRVKISDKPCPCGRSTKIFERIDGRSNDYCQLKNGRRIYYADDFGVDRKIIQNIFKFQFVYHTNEDKLVLNYVPINSRLPINKKLITRYYQKNFNQKVYFNQVNFIDNEKSGKFQPYKTVT